WPTADVNEAVYLTKARHAADPTWAAGDFFLETPDAHGVFYLLMGPLAAALPLEQAAWIGRIVGWAAVAVGFRHAAVPLLNSGWGRVVAAALFSLALRHTTAAGEWVIGGCEAKVFSWAFVLGGFGEIGRGRFASAVGLCGAATAFHPIVGGWALVATVATWLSVGRPVPAAGRAAAAAAVTLGMALVVVGIVPALGLTAGADPAARAEATRIYVVERLSHHLLVRTFADGMVARHVLAVMVWWLLHRLVIPTEARGRIAIMTVAAVGISVVGCLISLAECIAPVAALGLLRYYWFRLADVVVPFALATTATAAVEEDFVCRRLCGLRPAFMRVAVVAVIISDVAVQSFHWPLPGRTAVAARSDSKVLAGPWADACDWIRMHTPAEARFLTPRGAASFTWRTGRPEVVSWKNSPQDVASLIEWRKRITDCFSHTGGLTDMEKSTVSLGVGRLLAAATRYEADHVIVPLDAPLIETLPGERLYANEGYAVYRLTLGESPTPVTR
ncbi:MAG: DUF6798 domain-containing protein, partial [Pirellulales bacterium]